MSSTQGLFYAYAKPITANALCSRCIIVFANRATSDEWWRAVADSVGAGYTRFAGVKRISPQFYTHDPDVNGAHITATLKDEHCAAKFFGRVFFTYLPVNKSYKPGLDISIVPVLNYVDHISGHGFFIRSSLQRDQYWFYNGQRTIVSRDKRTKFTIGLVSSPQINPQGSDGLVMIGTDLVTIRVAKSNRFICMQDDRSLSTGYEDQEGLVIEFSKFDGGFEIGHTSEVLVSDEQGAGDRWELA